MVYLPQRAHAHELLQQALEYKVAFVPGGDFYVGPSGRNTLRLNFSNARL
jgi:DNA-binding transcriptional MocR family regulator